MKLSGKVPFIAIVFALTFSGISQAATSQTQFPTQEVLRPLVLPQGMAEFTFGFSWLETNQMFNSAGETQNMGAFAREMRGDFLIRAGVYDGIELQVGIPYIQRELDGANGMAVGFGDLDAAMLLRIFDSGAGGRPTSVMLGVRGIFPIGESNIENLADLALHPPSRGTFAVGPFIGIRETYTSRLAFLYTLEWDFYLRGRQEFFGQTVDSNYGDILKTSLSPIIQISDHIALWLSVDYTRKLNSSLELDDVTLYNFEVSELLEERPAIQLQLGHTLDLFIGTSWRISGKNEVAGWPMWAKLQLRF